MSRELQGLIARCPKEELEHGDFTLQIIVCDLTYRVYKITLSSTRDDDFCVFPLLNLSAHVRRRCSRLFAKLHRKHHRVYGYACDLTRISCFRTAK